MNPTSSAEPPYPNAPVQEVAFEIRFPGDPAVECRRDAFFELVRGEFPQVYVPKLRPDGEQAVALMPYHFKSADQAKSILTALNLFAFSTRSYLGFRSFNEEALRWSRAFASIFKIDMLTRTGLRYINVIPLLPDAPISDLLKIDVSLGGYQSTLNLTMGLQVPRKNGMLNMRLSPAPESETPQVVLDFDYVKTAALSFSKLESYLQESHDETKQLFESLLTDGYRAYLKGEGVG